MIDYLTHPAMSNFNPFELPSKQGGGGGMHLKTYFVKEALDQFYPNSRMITDTFDIQNKVVLIEPLRLALGIDPEKYDRDFENNDQLLEGLKKTDATKILLTTEFSMLRLPSAMRRQLVYACDAVAASCKFQSKLLRYAGIETPHIIRDTISDIYCSPIPWKDRKDQIVSVGQISWQKNTSRTIALFKALEGKVERIYVGSHALWRALDQNEHSIRLQNELYENCDRVIRECTIAELAKLFYVTKYGLWTAIHDTTSTGTISMLRAGIPVVSAEHGYAHGLPIQKAYSLSDQIQATQDMLDADNDKMSELSEKAIEWCEDNVSYDSFARQLTNVMRTVY